MKKAVLVLISILFAVNVYGYKVDKKYFDDYTIRATNEQSYYTDSNGNKIFEDTVLLIDHNSSTIYCWVYKNEKSALNKYRELISGYITNISIQINLIPSLNDKVLGMNTSNDGSAIWVYVSDDPKPDYSNLSDDELYNTILKKIDEGIVDDDFIIPLIYEYFESFDELFEKLYKGADPKEISNYAVIPILDKYLKNESNAEKIEKIKAELLKLYPVENQSE